MILVKFNWVKLWGIPLMAFAEVNVYAVPRHIFLKAKVAIKEAIPILTDVYKRQEA